MKTIILLLLINFCISKVAFAQTEPQNIATTTKKSKPTFGIKGGANLATIRPSFENESMLNIHAGLFLEKRFNTSDFGCQTELLYSKQGTAMTAHYQELRLNYLQLPVLFNIYSGNQVVLQAGGYGAYLIKAAVNDMYSMPTQSGFIDANSNINKYFKSADAGLCVGLRFGTTNKLQFGLRYTYGLYNINQNITIKDTQTKPELYNNALQVSAGFSL